MKDTSEDYKRKSDDMLIELNTRFNDFIDSYKEAERDRAKWREYLDSKMTNMEDQMKTMIIPYRLSVWIFTIVGGGFLVELTRRLITLAKDHINFR